MLENHFEATFKPSTEAPSEVSHASSDSHSCGFNLIMFGD